MSTLRSAAALLLLAGSVARADEPAGLDITVKTDAVAEADALPPGPSDSPKRPDLHLALDQYSLNTIDFNFPSGLRVLMQPDHTEPLVGVTMWVDKGSNQDPAGKEGIAHYIEHLWFKSKHGDNVPMTWDVLTEFGCYLNASTSNDWTNYMSVCPSETLPDLLKLESLRISRTLEGVTETEMLTEREVVRNELRMRMEIGGGEMFRYLMGDVYPPGHPYHRETIGTHDTLTNIDLPDIVAFATEHYVPQNATIVVVGDFDPDEAASLIFENFEPATLDPKLTKEDLFYYPRPGVSHPDKDNPHDWLMGAWDPEARGEKLLDITGTPKERLSGMAIDPPKPAQKYTYHDAPVKRPVITIGWSVPAGYRGKDTLMGITANTVGSAMWYRFADPTHERGLSGDRRIYTDPDTGEKAVSCGYWPNLLDSTVLCIIELASKDVNFESIAEEALDQVSAAWSPDDPMFERFFDRAKLQYMRRILFDVDTVASLDGRATQLAEYAHYTGKATYVSDSITEATKGSLHEARDLAFAWLQRDRAAVSILKPIPEEDLVVDSSESAYHAASRDSDVVKGTLIDLKAIDHDLIVKTTEVPDMTKAVDKTLPNGMRVVILPHGPVPIARATLVMHGGTDSVPSGLLAFMAEFTQTEDLSNTENDPLQIAGEFRWQQYRSTTEMEVEASAANLGGALWIMRHELDGVRPDMAGKADAAKGERGAILRKLRSQQDPDTIISYRSWDHLVPDHATLYPAKPDDFDRWGDWSTTDVADAIARVYQPANATLFIVGEVDPEATEALVEEYFGGWRARPGTTVGRYPDVPGPTPARAASVELFDDPTKPQTDVNLLCQTQPWTDSNRLSLDVAGSVLDDLAWRRLREDAGATYGAGGGFLGYEGGTARIRLSSLVQNDAAGLAVKTFQALVADTEAGKIDADRLAVLKLSRARKFGLGHQSVEQMSDRLSAFERPDGWEYLESYGERLADVTPQSIQEAIKGCSGNAYVTAAGPVDVIAPLLDKEGIAYTIVDWKKMSDDLVLKYDPKGYKKMMKARAKKEAKDAAAGG